MADLTVRGQCEEAVSLLHGGQPMSAVAVCRRVLQTFPKHIAAYSLLGRACLEAGAHEEAANLFRRVLGVDPEHALSYASLALIYEERGALDEALWQLERAFELSPGNQEIRRELRRLYGLHNLAEPERIKMTRASLVRAYLRGQLYTKAIGELRELAAEDAQRYDLRVALAEALWRDGRLDEAVAVCQGLLHELPNCLKANLILGQVWLNTEKDEEARALLQRAQLLDPENATAQALFGARSPLPPRVVRLPLKDEDMPALDLPYLLEEEEEGGEGMIIEGQAAALPLDVEQPDEATQPQSQPPTWLEIIAPSAVEPDASFPATAQLRREEGLSVLDIQYQYVEEHPEDYAARLDLARRLRDMRRLDQALAHYQTLIREDYETLSEVIRDLESLNRFYPGTHAIMELLLNAHARESRQPPADDET